MKVLLPRGAHLALSVVRLTGSAVAGLLLVSACIHETDVAVQPGIVLAKFKYTPTTSTYSSPAVVVSATATTTTPSSTPATQ